MKAEEIAWVLVSRIRREDDEHAADMIINMRTLAQQEARAVALEVLRAMTDAFDHVAHCRECGEMSVEHCAEVEGENSEAAKAIQARAAARALLEGK